MLLTYTELDAAELQGPTLADILVAIDADFRMLDGHRVLYQEPSFPVVELARSLLDWVSTPDPPDYAFESMTFEEVGALTVTQSPAGWIFGSVFAPSLRSDPVAWDEVERCIRLLVDRVATDLVRLGIDANKVLGESPLP
jgi:hypothetical protein